MSKRGARERLAAWIERSKLTQVETARQLALDQTTLSKILAGDRRPSLEVAVRMHDLTGIPPDAWVPTDGLMDANCDPATAANAK